MSNPAGWKVIYSRLAFTMPLKNLFSVILPISGHISPIMFPITLLFLRSFFPSLYIYSCAIHCILFSTHHQHLSLCQLVCFTQQCPLLSVSLSPRLLETRKYIFDMFLSALKLQALKAEQKCILALLNIPGRAVWLALKILDASRRNTGGTNAYATAAGKEKTQNN